MYSCKETVFTENFSFYLNQLFEFGFAEKKTFDEMFFPSFKNFHKKSLLYCFYHFKSTISFLNRSSACSLELNESLI